MKVTHSLTKFIFSVNRVKLRRCAGRRDLMPARHRPERHLLLGKHCHCVCLTTKRKFYDLIQLQTRAIRTRLVTLSNANWRFSVLIPCLVKCFPEGLRWAFWRLVLAQWCITLNLTHLTHVEISIVAHIREYSLTSRGEVSLYGLPNVLLVWIK